MYMKRSDLDLVYRSIDSSLISGEQIQLDTALRNDPDLRAEYERLVWLRSLVEEQNSPSFREGFSNRVMNRLSLAPMSTTVLEFQDLLAFMFRRVAVVASVAVILLLTYNLTSSGNVSLPASLGLSEEQYPEDLYDARIALETEGTL
tara:strand:- start:605 stop:1045 length:441 start_codon:yes stop_codon:yes gene_type:complete